MALVARTRVINKRDWYLLLLGELLRKGGEGRSIGNLPFAAIAETKVYLFVRRYLWKTREFVAEGNRFVANLIFRFFLSTKKLTNFSRKLIENNLSIYIK